MTAVAGRLPRRLERTDRLYDEASNVARRQRDSRIFFASRKYVVNVRVIALEREESRNDKFVHVVARRLDYIRRSDAIERLALSFCRLYIRRVIVTREVQFMYCTQIYYSATTAAVTASSSRICTGRSRSLPHDN